MDCSLQILYLFKYNVNKISSMVSHFAEWAWELEDGIFIYISIACTYREDKGWSRGSMQGLGSVFSSEMLVNSYHYPPPLLGVYPIPVTKCPST